MPKKEKSQEFKISSLEEAANDLFCFVTLLEAKRRQKNSSAKLYISLFLKQIVPVIEYEFSQFLEQTNCLDRSKFYTNSEMQKNVKTERQYALKEAITKSKDMTSVSKTMGLNFNTKTYDICIHMHGEIILQINYEIFKDKITNLEFWDALFSSPQKLLDVIYSIVFDGKITVEDYIKVLGNTIDRLSLLFDQSFSNKQYSYSVYKLFSKTPQLSQKEKHFILYRYRYVSSIIYIEQVINEWLDKTELAKVELKNLFVDFFRKWKAVIIETLHEDLKDAELVEIQKILNKRITNPSFFILNRKARDNIHYTKVNILSQDELAIIDTFQNLYFKIILQYFNKALFIDIDKECRTMTDFLLECNDKNISKEDLNAYYYYYFLKYKIFHHL